MTITKNLRPLLLLVCSLILALTPFYGISYLIALYVAKDHVRLLPSFHTIVGRLCLSFLLLVVSIMVVGLTCWMVEIQTLPLLVLSFFGLTVLALNKSVATGQTSNALFDRGDVVAFAVAILAPLIILVSFQLPEPSNIASYQFVGNAWDNSSHIIMLQSTSADNGYVYGHFQDIKEKIIMRYFNAYPQGWHLASSNIMNGFGVNFFSPDRQLLSLNAYVLVLIGWYVVAAFCIARVSWHLLGQMLPARENSTSIIPTFVVSSVFMQSATIWGAINGGSTNYFGMYAFLALMVAAIVEIKVGNRQNKPLFILATIFGAATVLTWLLPLPAVVLSLIFAYIAMSQSSSVKTFLVSLWTNRSTVGVALFAAAVILAQTMIFLTYSDMGGSQINFGRALGSEADQTLLLIVALFTFGVWLGMGELKKAKGEKQGLLYVTAPLLLLTLGIYLYQLFTAGFLTYYYGRVADLSYLVIGVFFVPAFCYIFSKIQRETGVLLGLVFATATLGLVFISTNQPTGNINNLFREHSRNSPEVAQAVIEYIKDHDPKRVRPVILRHQKASEDRGGNLHAKMAHVSLGCENTITSADNVNSLEEKIKSLDECAETLGKAGKQLFVITSNDTFNQVRSLDRDNIIIRNVP